MNSLKSQLLTLSGCSMLLFKNVVIYKDKNGVCYGRLFSKNRHKMEVGELLSRI